MPGADAVIDQPGGVDLACPEQQNGACVTSLVIGAGIAGLACARALAQAGRAVMVVDKGRGAGGRMATRRMDTAMGEVTFDHGAQYFTARNPAFAEEVRRWAGLDCAAPWPAAGDGAWVGMPSMNAPLKALANGVDVRWNTRAERLSPNPAGWTLTTDQGQVYAAESVVIALPAEQAAELLHPVAEDMAVQARSVRSQPCWTVMLAFSERLAISEDCLRGTDEGALGWAARNSAKPGRPGPEAWVVQAGPLWSTRNLDQSPERVIEVLSRALAAQAGLPCPLPAAATAHRWRYARPEGKHPGPLWDRGRGIGVCGDWVSGPRVEQAWLSGIRLASLLVQVPGSSDPTASR